MTAHGVDGCTGGWVWVSLGDGVEVRRVERFAEVAPGAGVDMPVGLKASGWRAADGAARAALGRRGATVFLVPPRPVLECPVYAEALALCRALTGKGCSKQAWNLRAKVLEVDAAPTRPVEVHPELAFQALAGEPLPPKTRWSGLVARVRLLRERGVELPERFPGCDQVAPDDVVDAAVVAWVMAAPEDWLRCGAGESDDRGQPIEIVYRRP